MEEYLLSFGKIVVLSDNIAEVIVNEGVVFDEKMVAEYHGFLLERLRAPFSLLINKKNSYSYTFKAQQIVANLPEIDMMAVVMGSSAGLMSTETLMKINESNHWNIKLFKRRSQALHWLLERVKVRV
ncbi:hypothetical protein MHTCC0001_07120 [Flavobacteriaceae bacterium MHTCC 0001]